MGVKAMDKKELVEGGLMRIKEVMKFLGISRSAVYKLLNEKKLSSVKIGGARRIPRKAVIKYAANGLEP